MVKQHFQPRAQMKIDDLRYLEGPYPVPSGVLPRGGSFALEIRKDGKLLQTLESPDEPCVLRGGSLREFYACHADRLSSDFLDSDATRELPGGAPPPPPDSATPR